MSILEKRIVEEEEKVFILETNDFFRPGLKQIRQSIFEIKKHFISKDGISVSPFSLDSDFQKVMENILKVLIENDYFAKKNIATDGNLDSCLFNSTEPKGFLFLAESLSLALPPDFPISRPSTAKCDVFVALPHQPIMVLTILDDDTVSDELVAYNASIASGVTITLGKFMNECVNPVFGVLKAASLESDIEFKTQIHECAKYSGLFVTSKSLSMTPMRYEKVLLSFWAGVAETSSVMSERARRNDTYLRFLTKEQCIVLVENMNIKDVEVTCQSGCGATTLMLEVTKRLSKLGRTLLVCESADERDKLRTLYPQTEAIEANDISSTDLSLYECIVDETGAVPKKRNRRLWRFVQGDKTFGIKRKQDIKEEEEVEEQHTEKKRQEISDGDISDGAVHYIPQCLPPSQQGTDHKVTERNGPPVETKVHQTRETDGREQFVVAKADKESHEERCTIPDPIDGILKIKNVISYLQAKVDYLEDDNLERSRETSTNAAAQESLFVKTDKYLTSVGQALLPKVTSAGNLNNRRKTNKVPSKWGHLYQLWHFQLGILTRKQLADFLEKICTEDTTTLSYLKEKNTNLEKAYGCRFFIAGELDTQCSRLVSCPNMTLDKTRVHKRLDVSQDGELVISPPDREQEKIGEFKKFYGTCSSSPIHLPSAVSTQSYFYSAPKYWETIARLRVKERGGRRPPLMEIGVSEESQVDRTKWARQQRRSWYLRVGVCDKHQPAVCARVWGEGQRGSCFTYPEPVTPDEYILRYGVVVDAEKGCLAFIDLDRETVLNRFDVVFRESLYPMFSIWPDQSCCDVQLKLVSGESITITYNKQSVISRALSGR